MLTNKEIVSASSARRRVICGGDAYAVVSHPWECLEIVRRADGASVFLQSADDCGDLIAELEPCESAAAVDAVLGQYDHVLS